MLFHEFDDVHAKEETKAKTLDYVMRKQKFRSRQRKPVLAAAIAACLFLMILLPLSYYKNSAALRHTSTSETLSYISIDINPSMEWIINSDEVIVDYITYNEDAENLSFLSSLKGKKLIDALKIMIENERFQSYMNDGFLEIGIYSEEEAKEENLQKQIDAYLKKNLQPSHYRCTCQNKETFEQARKQQMSFGKYNVIKEIISRDSSYSSEELEKKSMRELNDILNESNKANADKGHHRNRRMHSDEAYE